VSTLRATSGPLAELVETSLTQFVVGPSGGSGGSDGLMPSGFSNGPRTLSGGAQSTTDSSACISFSHQRTVHERNYAVLTLGVSHDPTAPPATAAAAQAGAPPPSADLRAVAGKRNKAANKKSAKASGGGGGGGGGHNLLVGRHYGWWTADLVPESAMHSVHPLPASTAVLMLLQEQQEEKEAAEESAGLRSGTGGAGGGGRSAAAAAGLDSLNLSTVRAPPWYFRKFLQMSDMLFVDDDVRLLAAEDAAYTHLCSLRAVRSAAFERVAQDAFTAFHISDVFAAERREQRVAADGPPALLQLLRWALAAVVASPEALDAKARKAMASVGVDAWVTDTVMLHALDGTRKQFETAARFTVFLRDCVKAAGLLKFASRLNDDDDRRRLGRLAAEIAALQGRNAAAEAEARARAAEDERFAKLKKTDPAKYQEMMADRAVADKAAAHARAKEQQAAEKEAVKLAAEAAKQREKEALELVKAEAAAKRARTAALNTLADQDPAAYARAMEEDAKRAEAAKAAGVAVGADGLPASEASTPSGRRARAQKLAASKAAAHRKEHLELQLRPQKLRFKAAPLFGTES
jgi:hypothetical protein